MHLRVSAAFREASSIKRSSTSVHRRMVTSLRLDGWHCCVRLMGLVQRAVLDLHLQHILLLYLLTCNAIGTCWRISMAARTRLNRFHAMLGSLSNARRLLSAL